MQTLPEPLRLTLEMVADLVAPAADSWWIISSAAVALHGAPIDDVRDVDLLMSENDAERTLIRAGVEPRIGQATSLFRSAVFGTWSSPPLPVEIFAGFEYAASGGWTSLVPASREAVSVGGRALFVPSAAELKAILESFGRPKDVERAAALGVRSASD